jgi:glutamyl-tRNA reductase
MNVVCFGLSHKTAELELRERFAIPTKDVAGTAARSGLPESVIVSTCNRVEYYAAAESEQEALEDLTRLFRDRYDVGDFSERFYRFGTRRTIEHLFRVVSGLESMVIGETEILGQVKKAYSHAASNGCTARHLNKLFQKAFNVAKEVRSRTFITRGPVSVGSVAVDLAGRIFGTLADCKVMILGAGETSELTARTLASRGAKSIFVSNRTYERASRLAGELGGKAVYFGEWESEMRGTDILISSTAAPGIILTRAKLEPVMRNRRDRPLFVIDLAVPRDVEPSVNELDGVFRYDIDSLQTIAEQSLEVRRREVAVCEALIANHVEDFATWLQNPDRIRNPKMPSNAPPAGGCQVARL